MNPSLQRAVEERLADSSGRPVKILRTRSVGGGSIHAALVATLDDGRRVFVKHNASAPPDMFEKEAAGLSALAAPGAIRVPRNALPGGGDGSPRFLVMEAIESGPRKSGFFEDFGCRFARLHRGTRRERFGFDHDNYIGSTPQPNPETESWVDFWREHRLGFQLRLAHDRGVSDDELDRLGDRLMDRLDRWIDLPDEPACLLHGDLWGGNYLSDEAGDPVLIDPAVYYGHREADLAMTRVFGGFEPSFYRAYEDEWPLPAESEERLPLYELYHLLNHLNLFGRSYRGRCVGILRRYVG